MVDLRLLLCIALAQCGVLATLHLDGGGPSCYRCTTSTFPGCLSTSRVKCSSFQTCAIAYSKSQNTLLAVDCTYSCYGMSQRSPGCPHGGVPSGYTCCTSDNCSQSVTSQLMAVRYGRVHVQSPLACPRQCDSVASCRQSAASKTCPSGQFCQISFEGPHVLKGNCKQIELYNFCEAKRYGHFTDCQGLNTSCIYKCCLDKNCVSNAFNILPTISPTTPTTTPTTTTTTTETTTTTKSSTIIITTWSSKQQGNSGSVISKTSSWSAIRASCISGLVDEVICTSMPHINCQDSQTLLTCPQTCGLCSTLASVDCHDIVVGGGCADLVRTNNICSNSLAQFTCPVTCGLCDEILDDVVSARFGRDLD